MRVIHRGVGGSTSPTCARGGFRRRSSSASTCVPTPSARDVAKRDKVDIQLYEIIYEAVESVRKALEGMLEPEKREVVDGTAEVRDDLPGAAQSGTIAGCYVTSGSITRAAKVRASAIKSSSTTAVIGSLRRFKDDVREVATGFECGIGIANFDDIKVSDVLEVYRIEKITRTL